MSEFDAIVEQVIAGQAPENVRAAAARGALPLPRSTLVRLYVVLLEDKQDSIREAAENSLNALTVPEIQEVLSEPTCEREILVHFAARASHEEALAERIAFHPGTPDVALALMAATGNAPVVDLVLTNQERLLARPMLLERLMINPALRASQRGQILELLARAEKLAEEMAKKADGEETAAAEEPDDLEEVARLLDVDVGELLSSSEILGAEDFEESEDVEIRSAFQHIVTLNAARKAILAMKGGREERQILIRDTNKIVSLGVLKNPRITDGEIEMIARLRNVTEEVLRQVGTRREWVKLYSVIRGLINNPKTPQGVAMNFIPRLTNRDLKELQRNRDIPELIRRSAKRTYETRTQRTGGFGKKR